MTLSPVSNWLMVVDCATKLGGALWIGASWGDSRGPISSIGCPTTFMIRPSVAGPTGTRMGLPVLLTGIARTSPSELSIAIHRTVCSPRC